MKVYVGVKKLSFLMPENYSLKDKRKILNKLRDDFKNLNFSFAEISSFNKWQNSTIAISLISNNKDIIKSSFDKVTNKIETLIGLRVYKDSDDIFSYDEGFNESFFLK
jgi:uncharacterized protein YlxP (DUF503 family)